MKRDGIWYFHKFVNGKRLFNGRKTPFSLDTSDEAVAVAKRDALLKAGGGAEVDRVLGRSQKRAASLEDVFAAYLTADRPRDETRKKNVARLKSVISRGGGNWRTMTVEDLTRATVEAYQNAIVADVRAKGHSSESEEMQQAKYSADRTLVQARSIFAYEKPFRKLHLPAPEAFLNADLFKTDRDLRYRPMSDAELAVFAAEWFELRCQAVADERAANLWLVTLCMRWLGMRNSEVEFCKPAEWLVKRPDGQWIMHITNRPYALVKGKGSVRDLLVVPWLREEIMRFAGDREWLIAGETETDRHEAVNYEINDWISDMYERAIEAGVLPAGTEARNAYDYRKQAGSELFARPGVKELAVSQWLGHMSTQTTQRWYVNLIGDLPSLA
jgi:integrase